MYINDKIHKTISIIILDHEIKELKEMSKDEELRRLAELREKGRRDEYARRQYAIKQGLQEGRKKGIKEGREEERIEIAKNMLKKHMKIEDICEITGLIKDEIEKLCDF